MWEDAKFDQLNNKEKIISQRKRTHLHILPHLRRVKSNVQSGNSAPFISYSSLMCYNPTTTAVILADSSSSGQCKELDDI